MKKNLFNSLIAMLAVMLIVVFTTCTIGLGVEVDIETPTLSFTYPDQNVIIRGDFVISGDAADDTVVSSVSVSLYEKGSNTERIKQDAAYDETSRKWSTTIHNTYSDASGWLYTDGEYLVKTTATDTSGRQTTIERSYYIDNTMPMVVLTRPATKGETETPDPYGGDLTFTGTLFDAHDCSEVIIDFYAITADGLVKIDGASKSTTAVNQNWEIAIPTANFDKLKEKIPAGKEYEPVKFYYTLTAYDSSCEYKGEGATVETGNSTSHYYLYDDISSLLAEGEKFPSRQKLSEFDAGVLETGTSRSTTLADTSITAENLLTKRISSTTVTAAKSGTFSIDPNNKNPTVTVGGFTWFQAEQRATGFIENETPSGTVVTITLKPGPDEAALRTEEVYVYLVSSDATTILKETLDTADKIDSSKVESLGTNKIINYTISAKRGKYYLVVDAKDQMGYTTTRRDSYSTATKDFGYGIFAFNINGERPTFVSTTPATGKVRPDAEGKLDIEIVAKDSDSTQVTLTVTKDDGNGDVDDNDEVVYTEQVSGVENASEDTCVFTWNFNLDAPLDGESLAYHYSMTDGKFEATPVKCVYTTDTTVPSIKRLSAPIEITDDDDFDGTIAETIMLSGSNMSVQGYADIDLEDAYFRVVNNTNTDWQQATAQGELSDDGLYSKFSILLTLSGSASGNYEIWYKLSDDTGEFSVEKKLCNAVVDKAGPTFTLAQVDTQNLNFTAQETINRSGDYKFTGTVRDDISGIESLALAINGEEITSGVDVAATDGLKITKNSDNEWVWRIDRAVTDNDNGLYRFILTSTDKAGNITVLPAKIINIDTEKVSFLSLKPNNSALYTSDGRTLSNDEKIVNGNLIINGSVSKTSLDYIKYQITDLDADPVAANWITVWNKDDDDALAADGKFVTPTINTKDYTDMSSHTIHFVTKDTNFEDETPGALNIFIDQDSDKPIVKLNTISNYADTDSDNSIAISNLRNLSSSFTFEISDDDGLNANSLRVFVDGTEIKNDGNPLFTHSAATANEAVVSTNEIDFYSVISGFNEDAPHYITIELKDKDETGTATEITNVVSGSAHTYEKAFFWYDKAVPEIEFVAVDGVAHDGTETIYKREAFTLSGTVLDGNKINYVAYKLRTKTAGVTATSADWIELSSGITEGTGFDPSGDGNWSVKITPLQAQTITGIYLLAKDVFGNASQTSLSVSPLLVVYENGNPSITITTPSTDGTYLPSVIGGNLEFKGTVETTSAGLDKVYLYYGIPEPVEANYATWNSLETTATSWAFSFDASDLTNGSTYNLAVRAIDKAGNLSTTVTKTFKADTALPSITETSIDETSKYGKTFNFSGTNSDGSGIKSITYTVSKDGGTPVAGKAALGGSLATTATPATWNLTETWDAATLSNYGFSGDGTGVYEYVFTITDNANRTNTLTRRVNFDNTAPVVNITSVTTQLTANGKANNVNGTITINGTITDNNSVSGGVYTIESSDSDQSAWTKISASTDASIYSSAVTTNFAFTINTQDSSTTDGKADFTTHDDKYWRITVIGKDGVGLESSDSETVYVDSDTDTPVITLDSMTAISGSDPTRYLLSSSEQISATITDDDGIASTVVAITSGTGSLAAATKPAANATSGRLIQPLTDLDEGEYTLTVTVTDNANAVTNTVTIPIAIDNSAPEVVFNLTQNEFRGNFELGVTATDSSNSVTLTAVNPAGVGIVAGTKVENTTPYTVTTTDVATSPASIDFTATDKYGRVTKKSFTYKVDLTAPTLTITTAVPATVYVNLPDSPIYQVSGTAFEESGESGLKDVRYVVLSGSGVAAPAMSSADWLSAAGISSWKASIDMTGKAAGDYTAYICARDNSDNYTDPSAIAMKVDANAPVLSDPTVSSASVFKDNFTINGTVSDTEGNVDKVTALYTGGTTTTLTLTGANSDEWTYTVPASTLAEGSYVLTITAYDKSGKTDVYTKTFVVDRTAPSVSYNNINADGTTSLTETAPKVYGALSDTNGISTATILFKKYDGSNYVAPTGHTAQTVTGFTTGTKSHNFTVDMSTMLTTLLTDGLWQATIAVTDVTGNTQNVTSGSYRVDRNNPEVAISSVKITGGSEISNSYVASGSEYTISGTMSDVGGIATVAVQLMKNNAIVQINSANTKSATLDTINGTWTVDIGAVFSTSGSYNLIAIATDKAGRTKEDKKTLLCDTAAPTITFISPFATSGAQTTTLIGNVTISGKSTDDAMSSTQYAVGGTLTDGVVTKNVTTSTVIGWTSFSGVYDWSETVNTTDFADAEYATQSGTSTIWTLPIHIKAVDVSGNTSYATLEIKIDTDADKPVVEFATPSNGATVGGQFQVTGTATDNTFVNRVYMQVQVVGANYTGNVLSGFTGSEVTGGKDAAGNDLIYYFTKVGDDDDAWYLINGTTGWNYALNKLKEFDKENLITGGVSFTTDEKARDNYATTTKLIVRVKALDTKTSGTDSSCVFGYSKEIELTLQSGAPSIVEDDMPLANQYISGTVNTNFTVTDDEGISSLNITLAGTTTNISYSQVSETAATIGGFTVTASDQNATATSYYKTWTITRAWDTTSVNSTSATITIEATDYSDSSAKTSTNMRTVYIDNTPPSINQLDDNTYISGAVARTSTSDNIAMVGTEAELSGDASDAASGIDKVILYFTQTASGTTKIFTMGGTSSSGGIDAGGTTLTTTLTIDGTARPFPESSLANIKTGKTDDVPQKYIVIDKAEGGGDTGDVGDQDGYNEQLSASGSWYVKPDSTNLNDGVYDVHYVAVDKAGNIAYKTDKMLVQNHKPTITSVKLFTDIDLDGTIESAEYVTVDFGTNVLTNFVVRNSKFKIGINATVTNGSASYVLTAPTDSTQNTSGSEIIIDSFGTDSTGTNDKNFKLVVSDVLGLKSEEFSFSVTYKNIDNVPPEVELFELNTDVATGTAADTGSISTDGGHIELRADSLYNNDTSYDPDVSGTIIIRGKATDNQRLSTVSITLGGVSLTILTWSAENEAMTPATNTTVVSQELTAAGHEVEWAYKWDTATISDGSNVKVALLNATVAAIATDAASQNNTTIAYAAGVTSYNSMTVDVVPYITSMENATRTNSLRSRLGKVQVVDGDKITVTGFNLPTAASTTSGSESGYYRLLEANKALVAYNANKVNAITVPDNGYASNVSTTLTAPAYSGYVVAITNGVVSINNCNKDTLNNYESTSYASKGENLTDSDTSTDYYYDDRYLSVWQTGTTFSDSAQAISPSMDKYSATATNASKVYGSWSSDAAKYYDELLGGTRSNPLGAATWNDSPDDNDMCIINDVPFYVILDNWQGSGTNWSINGLMIARKGYTFATGTANLTNAKDCTIEIQGNATAASPDSSDGADEMMFQFKNPKITGYYSDTTYNMYVSYFDNYAKCLKYAYFTFTGTDTTPTVEARTAKSHMTDGHCVVDGYDTTVSSYSNYAANVGLYSDIVVDTKNSNIPVIAYCDSINGILKIARGKSTTPETSGAVVTTEGTTPTATRGWYYTTITNPTGVQLGKYVSMTIDDNGNLHIATQDSENGDLYYIYATYASEADNGYTITSCTKVDSANSVGKWTDIKLTDSSKTALACGPVISYLDSTNIETKKAVKAAYYDTTNSVWESMTAPITYSANDDKASLVLSAYDGAANPVLSKLGIGYQSSSFATAFLRDED